MLSRFLLIFATCFLAFTSVMASVHADELDLKDRQRAGGSIGSERSDFLDQSQQNANNAVADDGKGSSYFIDAGSATGDRALFGAFAKIARDIKNVGQLIAVVMLIISVLVLVFSESSEEDLKKWRNTIVWASIGIILMQAAYSVFNTFYNQNVGTQGQALAIRMIENIIVPFVSFLLLLGSFAFVAMAVYAFYLLATANGDEEQQKKGYKTVITAIIGFLLLKFPPVIVRTIYGTPGCTNTFISLCTAELPPDISGTVRIFTNIINYVNGFLAIVATLLFIYAGWLVLYSRGDEEKLKKARNIFLYAMIGFVIIVISHALFRFFVIR